VAISGPREGRRSGFTRTEPDKALPLSARTKPCTNAGPGRPKVVERFGGVIPGMLVCSRPVANMPVIPSSNGGLVVWVKEMREENVAGPAAGAAGFGREPGPQFRRTPDEHSWGSVLALRGGSGFSGPGLGLHTSFHSPARETLGGRAPRAASCSDHHIGLQQGSS
jgi:hypothetical protein